MHQGGLGFSDSGALAKRVEHFDLNWLETCTKAKSDQHNFERGSLQPLARLAQSVERKALNLVVVGSSPTVGVFRRAGDSVSDPSEADLNHKCPAHCL